jgi:ribonuclease E
MANKMLIDATHSEETRVVVLRGNRVEEFDFETAHRRQLRGNIYLAKVTRVEPSLQAAFVDYGGNRHGFLAFSEIHPDYYQIPVADRQALIDADARAARDEDDEVEQRGRRPSGRGRRRDARRSTRSDETVGSDASAAEEPAREAAEVPAGENVMGERLPDAPDESRAEPVVSFEQREPAPIGETANPPTPAEIATTVDQPQPGFETADTAAEPTEASFHADVSAPAEDGATEAAPEPDRDGNGHGNGHAIEEEEEVVESVGGADAMEEVLDRAPRYRRQYKIQEVIKRRQVMLVQVVKEERGTKGAALTTYLSLAGRYCVLMPNTARGGGISRKITSADDRKRLREIADELEVPEGMGVILRTAGANRTKAEVKRDFEYLLRMWEQVRDLTLKSTAPMLVYEEGSLAKRSIRDLYTKDIDEIVVAGDDGYRDAKDFMRMLMPSHAKNVKPYNDLQPIFTRYGIESQLDAMFSPTVQLRSGGYIVLNQTEALVSIDVNSGRSTREHHIEDTALKTNVEAAEEIARQLRLRDLAGLIVIDFIDMDEKRNNRTVERRLKDALRNDRARIQVGRISHFGLLEMSRQRIRSSVLESSTEKCVLCGGTGHVRSVSSVALQLLRSLEETLLKGATHNQIVRTRPEIALYVLNQKRTHLSMLEERFRISITVNADPEIGGQVGFTIDRGEQVHSPEQARALLAQSEATPVPQEEDEPEAVGAADDLQDAESVDETEPSEPVAGEDQPMHGEGVRNGESVREGGRGRGRRRRRRGRGRSGEDREPGPQPHHDQAPLEHGQFAHEMVGEGAPLADREQPLVEAAPPEGALAQSHEEGSEPYTNGNGERRRRRRGRRGGRRNRRDREGQDNGDFTAPQGSPEQQGRQDLHGPPQWTQPSASPPPDIAQETYAPRIESVVVRAIEAEPLEPEAAAAEPPRRRSTVREPAPSFSADAPMATPMPPAPPVVQMSTEADDAGKPRRTGWWAKRLLGGDKG